MNQAAKFGTPHMAEDTITDATKLDATVKVERKGMSFLQWVGVVGVGSALALYIIPKIMKQDAANQAFIQNTMISAVKESSVALTVSSEAIKQSAAAQVKSAEAMEDLTDSVDDMNKRQEEMLNVMRPLTQQLDRVADQMERREAEQP